VWFTVKTNSYIQAKLPFFFLFWLTIKGHEKILSTPHFKDIMVTGLLFNLNIHSMHSKNQSQDDELHVV
jgi:hypothetical protein